MGKPWEIHQGDVRRVCKRLEENSFDALLCDPPYGLSFMGRRWDYDVPTPMLWAEVERVLKPGAHGIIFGGSRTFHRTTTAVEDGGFEIRDVIQWLYGSGFPKSLNVSKAIDSSLGNEREVTGTAGKLWEKWEENSGGSSTKPRSGLRRDKPASDDAAAWHGYGTALKPGYEPALLVRKYPDGTVAENALKWGVGGIAIDVCRIGCDERFVAPAGNDGKTPASVAPVNVSGYEGQTVVGRWPSNVIFTHDDRCVKVGTRESNQRVEMTESTGIPISSNRSMGGPNYGRSVVGTASRPPEELWACVPNCPVRILDDQAGDRPGMSGGGKHRQGYPGGMFDGIDSTNTARNDTGGPSRFFYTAKADAYQRNAGCETLSKKRSEGADALRDRGRGAAERANIHPTVKPLDLIRYLASLILPPKRDTPRRMLVPFSGSGSEMIACMQAGWEEVVGIELQAEYIEIATARIKNGGVLSALADPKMRRRKKGGERETRR